MKHNCLLFVFSESIWTTPKEGYMTIEEYNRLNLVYNAKAEQQLHQESKFMRENADELVSKYRREQLKVFRSETTAKEEEEKEIERETYEEYEEPGTSAKPYGRWQSVVQKYDILIIFFFKFNCVHNLCLLCSSRVEKPVDLQLPTTAEKEYFYVPAATIEPPPRVFKEKTVKSLTDEDCCVPNTFKKRKFGGNKRNARQRLDDDD